MPRVWPPSAAPILARGVRLRPLGCEVIRCRYPAGLRVDWITTHLWTIGQQYLIKRRIGPPPAPAQASESANSPDAGKTFLFVPKPAVYNESGHGYVWVVQKENVVRRNQAQVATTTEDLAGGGSGPNLDDAGGLKPLNALRD